MKLDSLTASRPAPFLCAPASTVTLTHAKYDVYLKSTESLCCLESSYKGKVELWLCRCADALQRLFVPFQLLPSPLLPGCPWVDREPLCGKGVGCSVLPKHKLHGYRCVQRQRKQQMNGEGLVSCPVVGKWWGLAQAHLGHFHLINDFRHFVAVLVLGREGECGHCGGLMDTRRLLFFPSTCSSPSLRGHYWSLCFGQWDKAVVSSVTEMKWILLCSHICQNLGPPCSPCWGLTAWPPKPPPHPWWASLHPHSAN